MKALARLKSLLIMIILKKQIIDGRFKHKLLDKLSDYQVIPKFKKKLIIYLGKIIGYKIGCKKDPKRTKRC